MTLIQTFELARDFSPIYVNLKTIADVCRDICNSFQYIKTHTHTSLPNESNMHVFMIIV